MGARKLSWYDENLKWITDGEYCRMIVTGRYNHHEKVTKIWLDNNKIYYDFLVLQPYTDWNTYVKLRKNYVRLVVKNAKIDGKIVWYFEDNKTIYDWAKSFDPEFLKAYKITDGRLMKDE